MNTVAQHVVSFVARFPPFVHLPKSSVFSLCQDVKVTFFKSQATIFKKGEHPHKQVYLVYKGSVKITHDSGEQSTPLLIDICEEGDLLGIRALLTNDAYIFDAIAQEETLIYSLSVNKMKQIMQENVVFADYINRSFTNQVAKLNSNQSNVKLINSTRAINDLVTIKQVTPVYSIDHDSSAYEAALLMTKKNIGALLIKNIKEQPIGIITEADLKRKVVAVNVLPTSIKVGQIMSSPVVTVSSQPKISDLMLLAASKNIRHFCVTKDGTPNSKIIGIISERDMLAVQGNNPTILLKKIYGSTNIEELKEIRDATDKLLQRYLEQETALHFVLDIITHVNDAITKKCIEFAQDRLNEQGYGRPPSDFCWLALGSEGRREQLLRTDQDNAIIYENAGLEEEKVNAYFIKLGVEVTDMLHAIGFEKCPFGIMASNKKCCRPLESWKRQFEQWILSPEPDALLHSHIFFDMRPIYGKQELAIDLQQHIFNLIDREELFISFLAKNAILNPVPLSFFRKFVVEKKGDYSNRFDIKARALLPISDAVRVLAYHAKAPIFGSTIARLKQLAANDSNNKDLLNEICMAFEILLRLRAQNAFTHGDDGRFIAIETLNKIQRHTLKQIFALTEQLQQLVRVRFQTDYFR